MLPSLQMLIHGLVLNHLLIINGVVAYRRLKTMGLTVIYLDPLLLPPIQYEYCKILCQQLASMRSSLSFGQMMAALTVGQSDSHYDPYTLRAGVISITTSFARFNPTTKLVINSNIASTIATTSEWSVFTPLGVVVPFTALTPSFCLFPKIDAESQILFPLSLDAYTLCGEYQLVRIHRRVRNVL